MEFDVRRSELVGPSGRLPVLTEDEVTRKVAMIIEGHCEGLGALKAAKKYGLSRARYFQLQKLFVAQGSEALRSRKTGPKTNYRRTDELVRQVIRHRFLDPEATPEVIAQKLRQCKFVISTRSVERVLAEYGLQKKTPQVPPARRARKSLRPDHQ
jgi:transposase